MSQAFSVAQQLALGVDKKLQELPKIVLKSYKSKTIKVEYEVPDEETVSSEDLSFFGRIYGAFSKRGTTGYGQTSQDTLNQLSGGAPTVSGAAVPGGSAKTGSVGGIPSSVTDPKVDTIGMVAGENSFEKKEHRKVQTESREKKNAAIRRAISAAMKKGSL